MRADRRELRTLAIALLASLLLWNLPFGGVLLYPFKLLATWMHELSHGIAMTVCGAGFDHILVYRDTSGLAYARNSVGAFGSAVIAAAGYMGTPVWGAVLLVLSHDGRTARRALLVLAALLVVTAMFVVAPTDKEGEFGPYAIGAIGAVVLVCAIVLPARVRLFGAHFIAAQACCNALLDIRVLMRPSQVVGGKIAGASDAHNMAAATFGTIDSWAVWTWAAIWLAWSLVVLFVALRVSGSRASRLAARDALPTASLRDGSDRDARRRNPATAPGGTDPNEPAGTAKS
jgi:peptidase M50B-like protein